MYDLKKYFNYYLSARPSLDYKLINPYPSFKYIVKEYRTKYNEVSKKININKEIKSIDGQLFSLPYQLWGGDYFEIKISVDVLNNIIKNNDFMLTKEYNHNFKLPQFNVDIEKMELSTQFVDAFFSNENIDKVFAMECVNREDPIICGDFSGLTDKKLPYVIIDGNHRAYGKIQAGEEFINGILVSKNIWINALLTEQDKIFVKIFNNINWIMTYRAGLITKDKLEKSLYEI